MKVRAALAAALVGAVVVAAAGASPLSWSLEPSGQQVYGTTVNWLVAVEGTSDPTELAGWVVGECSQEGGSTLVFPPSWNYPYYGDYASHTLAWPGVDNGNDSTCAFRFEKAIRLRRCSYYPYPPLYRCMFTRPKASVEFQLVHP